MSEKERLAFTMMTMAPAFAILASGKAASFKPPMNVIVSNVPGPRNALYLAQARMEAIYPISIPSQGMGLNITCLSYNDQLAVGFTGCRDTLPSLQHIAVYSLEALEELEAAMQTKKAA